MPLNATENYLKDRQQCVLMNFSGTVTTSDTYLAGAGGIAGDGFPMPAPGKILRLYVFDGTNISLTTIQTSFDAEDRVSVYAEFESPWYQVTVRVNGVNTSTYCSQVAANATLYVSVLARLDVY
jgi:hypothetical protein